MSDHGGEGRLHENVTAGALAKAYPGTYGCHAACCSVVAWRLPLRGPSTLLPAGGAPTYIHTDPHRAAWPRTETAREPRRTSRSDTSQLDQPRTLEELESNIRRMVGPPNLR